MAAVLPPAAAAVAAPATAAAPSPPSHPALPFTFRATVPFATPEAADVVCRAVSVDPELRAGHVRREMRTEGSTLIIEMEADEMRLLRAAVGAMYDLVGLAARAVERFGPPEGGGGRGPAAAPRGGDRN